MSNPDRPPNLAGRWCVRTESLEVTDANTTVDLSTPHKSVQIVLIRQQGLFFTWHVENDEHVPSPGVFEKVYLRGEFAGWQAYFVDVGSDNCITELNFIKVCDNVVRKFEITEVESGFDEDEPTQRPHVATGIGKRLSC